MTRDQVKGKIKEKFGTYSKFAKLAKIDRYELQRDFLTARYVSPEKMKFYSDLCDKLENKSVVPVLNDKKRNKIRKAIEKRGGVIKFCGENKQFAESTVFQILSGDYGDSITPTVKSLMEELGL